MRYRRVLDEALSKQSLEIQPILEISRTDVITDLLQTNNQAISFLPDFVSTHKDLVYLDVVDFDADIWKQLIYHKNKWMSKPLDAFIHFIVENEFQ